MNKVKYLLLCFLATQLLSVSAQPERRSERLKTSVDETTFRKHVSVLASDEYGGRKPLTPYEQKTIDYIAGEFRNLGLKPANGNSYFQDVPLVDATVKAKGGNFVVKGKKGRTVVRDYDDDIIWTAHKDKKINIKNAEFVFVGFGINAPEYGWNDYDGIDVKGKVVVALVNDPGYYDQSLFDGKQMTYYGRWIYKFEEASRQGAAGVLVVHDDRPATYGWNVVQASWWEHNLELVNDNDNRDLVLFKGWITKAKASELFEKAGYSYDELLRRAQRKDFKSFSLQSKADISFVNNVSVGISHNVRYLYLLAVSPVFSPTDRNGLCYEECALILKSLGCTDAMQFDGGHYSGLFAAGKYLERSMFARKIPAALGIKVKSNQNN